MLTTDVGYYSIKNVIKVAELTIPCYNIFLLPEGDIIKMKMAVRK